MNLRRNVRRATIMEIVIVVAIILNALLLTVVR